MFLYDQHLIRTIRRNLNFRKFKVALNATYRIFCKLFQELRLIMIIKYVDHIKKNYRAVFEL